jgi:hypothetical protein
MNGSTSRIIQMGDRVNAWNDRHPDDDAGNAGNAARIKALVQQAHVLLAQQREGFVHVHASATRKAELRRAMVTSIRHLSRVGRAAAADQPEVGSSFRFKPSKSTALAFRTAVGSMVESARTHQEVLVARGLAVPMLNALAQMLDQFDAAVTLGSDGRAEHVSATRQLNQVASDIARTVRVMDGRNRQRFQNDGQALGEWISASTVLGTPRGGSEPGTPEVPATDTPAAGDVRPAA